MKSWSLEKSKYISNNFPPQSLRMFDSKTQSLQYVGKDEKEVQIYVCGITPYDSAHLGHAFTYLTFDLIIRALNYIGKKTNYVQNVTDIDDPLFERARKNNSKWEEIVNSQLEIYRQDMTALNVLPPDHFVGVMENMDLIIEQIRSTIDKGLSYQIGTEWYFKIKNENLSQLVSKIPESQLVDLAKERGCDTERPGKLNPIDPIIWKASKDGEPIWQQDFGTGRPGWHIQCISLAHKYAKFPLDIQGGGKDLVFPHHSMCEEQTKALGFGELAKNYIHVGMVSYQGSKMSKSKGNLVFVHKLIERGVSPMVIRLSLIMQKWNSDWEFEDEMMQETSNFYDDLSKKLNGKFMTKQDEQNILAFILEDLGVNKAIKYLYEIQPLNDSINNISINDFLESLLGLRLKMAS